MNKKLEKFYSSYWFFLEVIVQSITILIAILLYTIGGNEFSILTHYISDLGKRSAPNYAFIPFYIGIVIRLIIRFFMALSLVIFLSMKDFKNKVILISIFTINIIILIGSLFMVLFPADIMKQAHNFGAILIFLFSFILCILFSIIVLITPSIKNYNALFGIILIIMMTIYFILPTYLSINTLFEWLLMFLGWIFYINIGILVLKSKKAT
ncbi:MAG: hypothetical protein ACFFBP_17125 [Promethearchaeota archaeon]